MLAALAVLSVGAGTASASEGPTVVTGEASVFAPSTAWLKGQVNPNGSETSYWFEYGSTTDYGYSVPLSPKSVGEGTEFVEANAFATELEPGEYHYRLVATNAFETSYGEDKTFVIPGADSGVEVRDPATGEPCADVVVWFENHVEGGCLVEDWTGSVTIGTEQGSVYTKCESEFDMRVDSNGKYYAVDPWVGLCDSLARRACQNEWGEVLPWPGQIEAEEGQLSATMDVCLQHPSITTPSWARDVPYSVEVGESGASLDQTAWAYPGLLDSAFETGSELDLVETE